MLKVYRFVKVDYDELEDKIRSVEKELGIGSADSIPIHYVNDRSALLSNNFVLKFIKTKD